MNPRLSSTLRGRLLQLPSRVLGLGFRVFGLGFSGILPQRGFLDSLGKSFARFGKGVNVLRACKSRRTPCQSSKVVYRILHSLPLHRTYILSMIYMIKNPALNLKVPNLWELLGIFLIMGNAGFKS